MISLQSLRAEQSRAEQSRELWIDAVRGIGILLVLLGHVNPPFKWYIYSFHMPLFFILSGYLFRIENAADLSGYIKKLFLKLIIPYFSLCFINLLIQCFVSYV